MDAVSTDGLRLNLTFNDRHVAALEMLCGRASIAFGHLEAALRDYRTQVAAVPAAEDGPEAEDGTGARVVSRIVTDGVRVREG